jgi:hypothetical protein
MRVVVGRRAERGERQNMTMRTAKRAKKHPGTLALSLMAAAVLGLGSPAGAQTTTTTQTTRTQMTLDLPGCAAENVTVNFDETHKTQTQNGPNLVRITDTFHDQGTGTGDLSAAQYQFSSMSTNTFRSSSQTFYSRISVREHLIRQGASVPGDDQYFLQTILLNVTNGNVVFKVQDVQDDCR